MSWVVDGMVNQIRCALDLMVPRPMRQSSHPTMARLTEVLLLRGSVTCSPCHVFNHLHGTGSETENRECLVTVLAFPWNVTSSSLFLIVHTVLLPPYLASLVESFRMVIHEKWKWSEQTFWCAGQCGQFTWELISSFVPWVSGFWKPLHAQSLCKIYFFLST